MRKQTKNVVARDVMLVLTVISVVIAAISCVVSIYAISRSTLDARYNISALDEGVEIDRTFQSSDSKQYQTVTVEPCKGVLKFGAKQTKGSATSSMTYKLYQKKTTSSSYSLVKFFYFSKNNVWSTANTIASVNGSTDYNVKLLKYSGTSTKSRVLMDIMVD